MAGLSISAAWNETAAFVRREARLLLPIAFLFIALPGAVLQMAIPTPVEGEMPAGGAWLLLLPLTFGLSLIGTLAILWLSLRPGSSVGEALQVGLRRFLPVFGALLLIGLGALLIALPLLLTVASAGATPPSTGMAAVALLLFLLMLGAYLLLWIRLILVSAVGTVEPLGPIAMIARSWQLTRGHFWKLLGFMLLMILAFLVVILAFSTVFGIAIILIAGPAEPGSPGYYLLMILSAFLQAIISMIFATLTARIYAQLSGDRTPEIFA